MAFDFSLLDIDPRTGLRTPPQRPPDGSSPRPVRDRKNGAAKGTHEHREVGRDEPGAGLPLEIEPLDPANVTPEARARARGILDRLGKAFSENRQVSQSQAYEALQKDVADNAAYLIAGGYLSLKELSELLMKLEEFRKRSSETGKTPATIVAEWLRGEKVPGIA